MQPKCLMTMSRCDAKCALALFCWNKPLEKKGPFGCCCRLHARYCFHPFPFWICHIESYLQTMVFGRFAVLFTTELCFSHKMLTKGVLKKLKWFCVFRIGCIRSVSPGSLQTFPSKPAKTAPDACLPHVAVSKELEGSYAKDVLWRWAKSWEGWERWGNWHSLQLMSTLCHKICSIWCYKPKYNPPIMWELICLGQGGPWLADPEGEIITPEVETASGLLQERRQQRWEVDQEALLVRYLEVRSWPLVHRPADQEARFQTFYPLTAASWWVHKGEILTTCVAESGDLWSHCSSSTCRLTVVWSSSESPWVPATFILL